MSARIHFRNAAHSILAEAAGDLAGAGVEAAALTVPVVGETVGPIAALATRKYVKSKVAAHLAANY